MIIVVLPTEKSLAVSFWTFFQISRQPKWIRKNPNHQNFLLMQGYLSKLNLEFSQFLFNYTGIYLICRPWIINLKTMLLVISCHSIKNSILTSISNICILLQMQPVHKVHSYLKQSTAQNKICHLLHFYVLYS